MITQNTTSKSAPHMPELHAWSSHFGPKSQHSHPNTQHPHPISPRTGDLVRSQQSDAGISTITQCMAPLETRFTSQSHSYLHLKTGPTTKPNLCVSDWESNPQSDATQSYSNIIRDPIPILTQMKSTDYGIPSRLDIINLFFPFPYSQ